MSRSPEGLPYSLIVLHDFERHPPRSAYAERPLHLTVIPSFAVDPTAEAQAIAVIEEACNEVGPIEIFPGEEVLFGHNGDIPVTRVEDREGSLIRLHRLLIERLGMLGCKFLNPQFAGDNYAPHITHKPSRDIPAAGYTCDSFSVVRKYPRTVEKNQEVVARVRVRQTG